MNDIRNIILKYLDGYSMIYSKDKKIDIHIAEIISKFFKSRLFLDYIVSQGFNPDKYNLILELNQDVLGSISLMLDKYKMFLLSTKVNYDHLTLSKIYGAYGYLKKNGIFIPKTPSANEYFLGEYKNSRSMNKYNYPNFNNICCEYDVVISNGIAETDKLDLILKSNIDFFLGDVLDPTDKMYNCKKRKLLERLLELKNICSSANISIDCDSECNKEYVLLSKIR